MVSAKKYVIRDAVADDAERVAALHTRVWRTTYRDLAPPEMFSSAIDDGRIDHWRSIISDFSNARSVPTVLVAETDSNIYGFVSVGTPRTLDFGNRGEIKQLYVDHTAQRSGLGRQLVSAAAARLYHMGYRAIGLAVVEGNAPAIEFYTALGGVDVGGFSDPGPIWASKNRLMVWDNISDFTA